MPLLLAGHETTANALAWTWYLLSGAPEAQAALHDEVDRALEDRAPGVDDVERLRVVRQVVTEAMRLYPPAWVLGRRAIEACRIGGYAVPAGTLIFMSPWVVQRDARWFDDPEAFRPARWTATFRDSLPKLAYFPFGGGARSCIGESFAWMELALVVATLAQRWHFALAPGEQVVPQPLITLRPRRGIRMIAHTRRSMRRSGTSHSSATAT
jgi:cytochrome P450